MVFNSRFLVFLTLCSLAVAMDWTSFKKNHVDLALSIPRIIGGEIAAPHQYPFQVEIWINGNSFCGGTLISHNYVLTAGHCGAVAQQSVDVVLGASNLFNNENFVLTVSGESVIVHEGFNYRDYQNDIALIKLAYSIPPQTTFVGIVSLPRRSDVNKDYTDETVTSIGWGLATDVLDQIPTTGDLSQDLRHVNVSVLGLADCGAYYNDYEDDILYVTEKNICTSGYKNKGTCNGDSGGPLLHNGVQIGLVSIGTDLCEVCSPSIFTRVDQYLDWIEEHSDVIIY